jgi:phage tail-like protein
LPSYRSDGSQIARFSFLREWPVRWTLSELDASANEVAMETIEIAHEGLELQP